MANYNPFSKDQDNEKKEQNWFMKTAMKAAAFSGTAFGVYGLWKMAGPARKILEKAVDDRMQKVIAEETYRSADHYSEVAENFSKTRSESFYKMKDSFDVDLTTAWTNSEVDLQTASSLKNRALNIESEIISKLEEEASYRSPNAKITVLRPGQKVPPGMWLALNKEGDYFFEKNVSLKGFEAEQLARLRYQVIQEYLETYGEISSSVVENPGRLDELANMTDFFSGKEYFQTDHIKDGFGKGSIDRVSTLHDAYMSDLKYAEIYYRRLKQLHGRFLLRSHSYRRNTIERLPSITAGGGYRQALYGNVIGDTFNPADFRTAPVVESLFDSSNPEIQLRRSLTSQGVKAWDPNSKFKILQQTDYSGHIFNVYEALKKRQEEGKLAAFSIDLFDYGTARNPDKRLRISLVHTKKPDVYQVEIPIGIDGRLPGATPGLSQLTERFHAVDRAYGFRDDAQKVINTTEKLLIDFRMKLDGSLFAGSRDSFEENPEQFVKQMRKSIQGTLRENAAANGSVHDLLQAMSIDDPALRDLVSSTRAKHHSAVIAAQNFVVSARNAKRLAAIKKGAGDAIVINIDLETLDNTTASPGKALLGQYAQVVKAGIVVQNGNTVVESHEISNRTGYDFYKNWDRTQSGKGFNDNLKAWLRKGVLADDSIGNEDERYLAQLMDEQRLNPEGWSNAKNRREFIQELGQRIRDIKKKYQGKQIFIATKNGINFDLKAFQMEDPSMYRELLEDSIDVQALHQFRNIGLGESNALNIEAVTKAMMGRLGVPESEYIHMAGKRKGDIIPERVFALIKQKSRSVQGQNTVLLDWTANAYKEFHDHKMILRPHASPRVDAALTAALLGEQLADYMAGNNDYLDAADHVSRLLDMVTKGPSSQGTLMELFRSLNNKTYPGFGVSSFSASSQGMVSKLINSFIELSDLSVFANPNNMGARRILASPFNMTINKKFKGKDKLARKYLGRFLTNQNLEDASTYMLDRVLRADDAKNQFSNTVMGNFIYLLDHNGDPTIELTKEYTSMFERRMEMSVPTDVLQGDPLINAKLKAFADQVKIEALKLSGGKDPTPTDWEDAEKIVRNKGNWDIRLGEEIVSAGKFSGDQKFPQRAIHGKIVSVQVDRDTVTLGKTSPNRLLAKIQYTLSGEEAFKNAQMQTIGGHAVYHANRTISEGLAFGEFGKKDIHGFVGSEFLKKGDVGAAKTIMLSTVLTHLYQQYEDPRTSRNVKATSLRLIREIQRTIGATSDLKRNKFIVNRASTASPVDDQVRLFGSTEIRLKQLVGWYRKAGLVWNKQEVADLHKNGDVGMMKLFEEQYKEASSLTLKQIKSKYECFRDLTEAQFASVKEDLEVMSSLFTPNSADQTAKVFMPVKVGGGWRLGMAGLGDTLGIYNADAMEARNRTALFRHDYLFGLMTSFHGENKSTVDFLTKYTFGQRYKTYKSVLATYKAFNDALFAEKLTQEPLNIDQIRSLVNVEDRVKAQTAKVKTAQGYNWGGMSTVELADAQKDRLALLEKKEEMKDPLFAAQVKKEADEITEILKTRSGDKLFQSMSSSKRIYSRDSISLMEKLSKERGGVIAFKLPTLSADTAHTIDVEQMLKGAFAEGLGVDITPYELVNLKDKLVHTVKTKAEHAKKGAPIRWVDGKLEIGAAIFDWDPYPGNMFTTVSGGPGLANRETQIKIMAMDALHKYQKIVTDSKGDNSTGLIDAARDEFNRKYLTYLLVGQPASTMSKFWKSGQFAVDGLFLMHKDMNVILRNIISLESTKPGAFKQFAPVIENIKNARMNTVLIHEKEYKNFRYVDSTFSGETVSAAKEIEKTLGKEMSDEFSQGKKVLPGGIFLRHPIPQAGYDGIRTGQFLVIPKGLADMIGVDDNSFFANPVYTAAQKGDFDGDHFYIHLKELGVMKNFKEIAQADDREMDLIMQQPEMQDALRKYSIETDSTGALTRKVKIGGFNSIISHNGDQTMVSTINGKGRIEFKTVKTSMLDISDVVDHTFGLISELSKRGGRATQTQILAAAEANASILISKNLIPLTTNLLKTRVQELLGADVHNVKHATAVMSFIGNISHGISGMSQHVIDMGKHPEKAATLSATLKWFQDPTKDVPEAKEFWMDMRQKQLGTTFDKQLEEDTWNFYSGRLKEIGVARKNSPSFRIYERQVLDGIMGRKGATVLDVLNMTVDRAFNDIPTNVPERTMTEQISDAFSSRFGRQIDVAPTFRKAGKWGAIGAAAFLGLSMFTPFGNGKSLNPVDMFTDIGSINGNPAAISSPLELGRDSPLDMVDASFSKEAFIRLGNKNRNEKKNKANIINNMLMQSSLIRTEGYYEFQSKPYKSYANYTTRVPTIGTNELNRRSEL